MATNFLSAGVNSSEVDLTTIIPAVSTTIGAFAGVFNWGPVGVATQISDEPTLVATFGKPSNRNAESWFTVKGGIDYGATIQVVRAANTTSTANNGTLSAVAATTNTVTSNLSLSSTVLNTDNYNGRVTPFDPSILWVARYPGSLGNSLGISVCDTAAGFTSVIGLSSNTVTGSVSTSVGSNTALFTFTTVGNTSVAVAANLASNVVSSMIVGDYLQFGNTSIGLQSLPVSAIGAPVTVNSTVVTLAVNFNNPYALRADSTQTSVTRFWQYYSLFSTAPGTSSYVAANGNTAAADQLHVVIFDQDGAITGVPGQVLEPYKNLSRATDATDDSGNTIYYKNVINQQSSYVWWANDRSGAVSNTSLNVVSATQGSTPVETVSFIGGQDGIDESGAELATIYAGYEVFQDKTIDISFVLGGKSLGGLTGEQTGNFIIDNITSVRKDCVALISLPYSAVVNNKGQEQNAAISFRGNLRNSSYGFLDTGYKYTFDQYNNVYRWVPLNGDILGIATRSDNQKAPWWSFAGYNRGLVKNCVKLAWNPSKPQRDAIYPLGINPVVTEQGAGTLLLGDRTLQYQSSAFDRINVRRLFIVLEKAISLAAKYQLFEFNDTFSQSQFKAMVKPYLTGVQSGRGITDFLVVCDSTNNTAQVVDSNQFVGDIYIKPARSINFIQLNFVAVSDGVDFNTIVGQF